MDKQNAATVQCNDNNLIINVKKNPQATKSEHKSFGRQNCKAMEKQKIATNELPLLADLDVEFTTKITVKLFLLSLQ